MEPKLPTPNSSPERAPIAPGGTSFEYGVKQGPETPIDPNYKEHGIEQAREQLSGIGAGDTGATQVTVPPTPPQPTAATSQQGSVSDDVPLVAADEDLIERAWVDKAKRIVIATRDDPYAQEREVSKLQADYLQKRYGKQIRLSN